MKPDPDKNAIRAGDNTAFDTLFDEYAPGVMSYLLRLLGNRALAKDLTQDTFRATYAGRESFGGRGSSGVSWLLGIAWRRWRDRVRRRDRPTESLDEANVPSHDPINSLATTLTVEQGI